MLRKIISSIAVGYAAAVYNVEFSDQTETGFTVSWEDGSAQDYSVGVFESSIYDDDHFVMGYNVSDGSNMAVVSGLDAASFYGVQVSAFNSTSGENIDTQSLQTRTDGSAQGFYSLWNNGATGYMMWDLSKAGGYSFMFTMPCEVDYFGIGADMQTQVKVVSVDNTTFEIYASDKALASHDFFTFWTHGCDFTDMTDDLLQQEEFDGYTETIESVNMTMSSSWSNSDGDNVMQMHFNVPAASTMNAVPSFTLITPCEAAFVGSWGITEASTTAGDAETSFEFSLSDIWQNSIGFTFSSDGDCGASELIVSYKIMA